MVAKRGSASAVKTNNDQEKERVIRFGPPQPNGSSLSCGALTKDSFHNLRAPPASSACQAAARTCWRAARAASTSGLKPTKYKPIWNPASRRTGSTMLSPARRDRTSIDPKNARTMATATATFEPECSSARTVPSSRGKYVFMPRVMRTRRKPLDVTTPSNCLPGGAALSHGWLFTVAASSRRARSLGLKPERNSNLSYGTRSTDPPTAVDASTLCRCLVSSLARNLEPDYGGCQLDPPTV